MSSERHGDDPREQALDDVLDGEERAAEVDAARHVPPAFAAIVARAHRIDPAAVPAAAVDRARTVSRGPRAPREAAATDELEPFVRAARADAERDVAAREADGVPPCGLLLTRRVVRVQRWMVAVTAFAAAAAVMFTLDWLEGWRAARRELEGDSTQAVSAVRSEPVVHEAAHVDPPLPPVPASRVRAPAPVVPKPALDGVAVLPSEPAPLEPTPPEEPRAAAPKVPWDAGLRRLDAQAQAALARGDRSRADGLYTQVIARGRRHPLVELAFAERFALARGQGTAVQRGLWNDYLAAFPSGRFADDAHAGLCRTAAVADKAQCWQAYVDRFPAGAYRRHAERWLATVAEP